MRGGHSSGVSRNDTAHPRSSRPSSATLTKTKSPLQGNPIQILFARAEKVRGTNPQEDLKFWLSCATPKDSLWGANDGHQGGTPHSLLSVLTCPYRIHTPQLRPKHWHYPSHVTLGRSQAHPSLSLPIWTIQIKPELPSQCWWEQWTDNPQSQCLAGKEHSVCVS